MSNFLKPSKWTPDWIKRHSFESSEPPCALASCSRPQSLWQRLRRRSTGVFLQDVFYCKPQCLESALVGQLSHLRGMTLSPQPTNRIPLGLLMVARGKLTHVEVRAALEAQRRARHGKIGEWIEKLGFATEQEVTSALALQWGCPVASSFDPSTIHSVGNVPLPILEAFQMLPFNHAASTNTLYIAFGERVDHAALYAIEKILECRTQPCVAGRKSVARQLDAMRQLPRPTDVEFGPMDDLAEMGRIAASYTARLSPEQVRLARVGKFIWLRLERSQFASQGRDRNARREPVPTNLVFRLPTECIVLPVACPFRQLEQSSPQIT
jgi:Type II secretion system (T2SS), protein E, N-terminal domain